MRGMSLTRALCAAAVLLTPAMTLESRADQPPHAQARGHEKSKDKGKKAKGSNRHWNPRFRGLDDNGNGAISRREAISASTIRIAPASAHASSRVRCSGPKKKRITCGTTRPTKPIEPAMLNTAVLAGLNVQNFRDAYQRLIDRGGAKLVRDRDMLAGAVNYLLKNPAARRDMIAAGAAAVEDMRGALDRTFRALDPFIQPLMVKSRLRNGG